VVFLVLLVLSRVDLTLVFVLWLVGDLALGLGSLVLLRRHFPVTPMFHAPSARKTVLFGLKAFMANLIQFLNYRLDFFLVNAFLNVGQVGHYSTSVAMAELLLLIPYAAGTMVFPRVSDSTVEEANRQTPPVFRHVLFWILATTVVFALTARFLFPFLFSRRFDEALPAFYILLPGIVFLGASRVIANDLVGRGKPLTNTAVSGISLVLNTALNVFFIPAWGIRGAAVSSSIAYTLAAIFLLVIFLRTSKMCIADLFRVRKSDLAVYWSMADRALGRSKRS